MSSKVLVTGGCGYIGSHVVRQLSEAGYEVVVIDDLSTGHKDALIHGEKLVVGNFGDEALLTRVFAGGKFAAVMHFAASIVVPESVTDPLKYYENNTANAIRLFKSAVAHAVPGIVFSSTAAVYGEGAPGLINETCATAPTNPYGRSKLMDEWILQDVSKSEPLRHVILRYFNVAGSEPQGRIGQRSKNATHLIKVASEVAVGKRARLQLYGSDYPTRDGTCVRDYVHVEDVASAHVEALRYIEAGGSSITMNCGYGRGHSVKEVVTSFERITGKALPVEMSPRRPGDVSALVADSTLLRSTLNWRPKHQEIDEIVRSALAWERKIP